jgi:type IX secretion system PorP/SprF family membrane protein
MAQTDPLYAQYLNNTLLINPAYSGLNNTFSASATFRKQWAGFEGSPSTLNASAHTSLFENKMGAGLIVLKDQIGANSNTEVHATYAYRINLGQQVFSFGLQAGMVNFRSANGDLHPYDPGDPVFSGTMNTTKPSFGAGAILHSDRYLVGISVPRMLKARATFDDVEAELYSRHFYIMGSYIILVQDRVQFKPSVLLKGVKGAKLSADVNLAFNFNEKYTAGIFTRNLNTYGVLAQVNFNNKYRLGYIFEVPSGNSVGTRFTTHEFMVGINTALFRFNAEQPITNW